MFAGNFGPPRTVPALAPYRLVLRPLVDADIALVEHWLGQKHVCRWYDKPEEWLHELRSRHDQFWFIHHLIACDQDRPFGFCQYYRCEDSEEPEYQAYWPQNAHSIDYLIGEPQYLGCGVGKGMVNSLACLVFELTSALVIVAHPDHDNAASRATLISSHFEHDIARDLYVRRRPHTGLAPFP